MTPATKENMNSEDLFVIISRFLRKASVISLDMT